MTAALLRVKQPVLEAWHERQLSAGLQATSLWYKRPA